VPDVRLTVVLLRVNAPDREIEPVPLACRVVVAPPPKLALTAMAPLLVVVRLIAPAPVTEIAPDAVIPVPAMMEVDPFPPVIEPTLAVPRTTTFSS
jgi:hypothetical protein